MSWSLRLGSVSGIAIRVHFTFALLVAAFASHLGERAGARGAVFGVLLVLGLFACVVLHELGHAHWAAANENRYPVGLPPDVPDWRTLGPPTPSRRDTP